jgi:aspartyl-tRNA(Asn)/glutamyl-tRNA(Gln) amidotransferase subunit A
LPADIAGLREWLARGRLSRADALAAQWAQARAADAACQSVVRWHESGASAAAPHAVGTDTATAGPLSGIALAHKDIFAIAGQQAGCGRGQPPDPVADRDADVLTRLAQAGAVNLAALSMAELACGSTGESPWSPRPVNALSIDAVVGGSSGGSAAAVASGLCYASLGTDTAGSVRIPAATCGLIGLKPTWDAISRQGVHPLAPSLDTVGVLARTVADAALVYACAAHTVAPELTAAATTPYGIAEWLSAPRPLRIATHLPPAPPDDEVISTLQAFITRASGDHSVHAVDLPQLDALSRLAHVVLHFEAAAAHRALLQDADAQLGASARAVLIPGAALPEAWYHDALAQRGPRLQAFVDTVFADADILLVPALPRPVPDWDTVTPGTPGFDVHQLLALHRWMPFVNYLGLPALVFPIGHDRRGRPVTAQAVARPHAEAVLLAFAHRYDRGAAGMSIPFPSARASSATLR